MLWAYREGDEATTYKKDTMHKNAPLRVAKFIVTDIDELGVYRIKSVDRGLYKEFRDSTYGIPEYDYDPKEVLD